MEKKRREEEKKGKSKKVKRKRKIPPKAINRKFGKKVFVQR